MNISNIFLEVAPILLAELLIKLAKVINWSSSKNTFIEIWQSPEIIWHKSFGFFLQRVAVDTLFVGMFFLAFTSLISRQVVEEIISGMLPKTLLASIFLFILSYVTRHWFLRLR